MSSLPWVEKYRPSSIDKIKSNDIIIKSIKSSIEKNYIQNMILYGPSGVGKTSLAIAMSKKLFKNLYHERVLELNASDERGINTVRNTIKNFSKLALNTNNNCPQYKIIILDEVDSMTFASQFALRRIMEQYSTSTKFILICNYISKIIEPIVSRCVKYQFKKINSNIIYNHLQYICEKENVKYKENALNSISHLANGDMRLAIQILHKIHICSPIINMKTLIGTTDIIPEEFISQLYNLILKSTNILKITNYIVSQSFNHIILLEELLSFIIKNNIDDKIKILIPLKFSEIEYNLNNNGDEFIQFTYLFTFINHTLNN